MMKQRKYTYILIFNIKQTLKKFTKVNDIIPLIKHLTLHINFERKKNFHNNYQINDNIPFSKFLTKCMHIVDLQIAHS
jgi:hypothetical protein